MLNTRGHKVFNLSTKDFITVNEILDLVLKSCNIKGIIKNYTGGDRGWKGDVPIVRINDQKFRKLGWKNKFSSKNSVIKTILFLIENKKKYGFGL